MIVPASLAAWMGASAVASAQPGDPAGRTTLEQTITGDDPSKRFSYLRPGPRDPFAVREDLAQPQFGRERRRKSIVYLGQLTDFQLADEESPAREERFDAEPTYRLSEAGFRPQETLVPHQIEMSIRQMNAFLRSPVAQGDGTHARMLNAVMTGDLADNMQRNETEWVVRLLEGGPLNPNSGTSDLTGTLCAPGTPLDDPAKYTGVQDYDDYLVDNPLFYDPDRPFGAYAGFPSYPGLVDRAQAPFTAQGLAVPSYVAFGNHDGLYLGTIQTMPTVPPQPPSEPLATGCIKAVYPVSNTDSALSVPSPAYLQGLLASDPGKVMAVPPDANRQYVDKRQFKAIHAAGVQPDDHGFAHVDPDELKASNGFASYYAFSPRPGLRYIVLDTLAQAGTLVAPASGPNELGVPVSDGSRGNLEDPQFRWLERELKAATERDELILLFGHHGTDRFDNAAPDEVAPCTAPDEHGHDVNPSCDGDPRPSTPLHDGRDLVALVHRYPHAVGYIAGHTHRNQLFVHGRPGGSGFWELGTSAIADWPSQHRVIDVMDNHDGTLSLFATLLDHAAPIAAPPAGTPADSFDVPALAAIGRVIGYNDPQYGPGKSPGGKEGERNVELLVDDPRRNPPRSGGRRCASVRGKVTAARLHRATLGERRTAIRGRYPSRTTRGRVDSFCLADGRRVRVGYGSAGRLRSRAALLASNSRHLPVAGIRAGSSTAALRRRLRGERRVRVGRDTWYLSPGPRATRVFRTNDGRVREAGIAARSVTRTPADAGRFLRGLFG